VVAALAVASLLINTVSVDQQDAPATGHPTLSVDGGQIYFTEDGAKTPRRSY